MAADAHQAMYGPPMAQHVYLHSVRVEGFRGVGPTAQLDVPLGPGLTLVVGRNGSGKSSFAEGLEILLTGSNFRWAHRSKVWRDGWRNLHHPERASVSATFAVEGRAPEIEIVRTWADGAAIDDSRLTIRPKDAAVATLDDLGWTSALEMYRPFLSYNELGAMFDGPSELHDRLMAILGLDEFDVLAREARDRRLELQKQVDAIKARLAPLLTRLDGVDDPRAALAAAALRKRIWDLGAVEAVLGGAGETADVAGLAVLRALGGVTPPSVEDVIDVAESIRDVVARTVAMSKTPVGRASDVAKLLRDAIAFHGRHGDEDCPVCGTLAVLDDAWQADAEAKVRDLESAAAEAMTLNADTTRVLDRTTRLMSPPPTALERATDVGLGGEAAHLDAAWRTFVTRPEGDLLALADHLEATIEPVHAASTALDTAVDAEQRRREVVWRPLANDLAAWLTDARTSATADAEVKRLATEEKALKAEQVRQKHDRFQPVAASAKEHWALLRQQSNVELERIVLEGTGTSRRVDIGVAVDGVEGAALGVMSQGELHAIALSLFLPRATMDESPFRFIAIDDPVQSMDPARVDGLARVLESVAKDRQVIVFTHDDRLPEAVRRMAIDATVVEVTRREESVVELRKGLDPVHRHLDDAMAIAKSREVPEAMAQQVVPGYCRSAIEAACVEVVRRKRLKGGASHQSVEAAIAGVTTLTTYLALAMFDDAGRGGDVAGRLGQWGDWAMDAYGVSNRGAHAGYRGSLSDLVSDTTRVCNKIGQL